MKIKIQRVMDADKVRAMCIKYEYCTCCDNEHYSRLLNHCDRCPSDKDIQRIADLIINYSDTDKLCYKYGCDWFELYESICFNLINDCTYTTVEIERGC